MRIGMMADIYKPVVSGVTNYIALNKQYLEGLGHKVYVFTFGNDDQNDGEKHVVRSRGLPLINTGAYLNFYHSPDVKALLQTMDVVHVHHPFISGQLALRYCKSLNIPIVFTNHTRYDMYLHAYMPLIPEGVGETFMQAFLPPFCRQVDLVISPSEGMAKILRHLGVDDRNLTVIPNGIDLTNFINVPAPRSREQFGFTNEHVLLTYVGRIAPEKNLQFLVHSFAGITHAYEQARLLMVGGGSEMRDLQTLAEDLGVADKVYFTGMVPYADLPAYLAMCDAFVTPSMAEVHPLTVIEAMATGLPVLGIDSPGIEDTVVDGVNGLVASEDLPSFTAKMSLLINDSEMRRRMSSQARASACDYAIEKTAPVVLDHYQRLVVQSAPRRHGIRYNLSRFLARRRQ